MKSKRWEMKSKRKYLLRCFLISLSLILLISPVLKGQKPPGPVRVTTIADLAFGAFYQGASGGSVVVNTSNGRSPSGDVILFGGAGATTAVFRIQGDRGTQVNLLLGSAVTLTRSGGGGSMQLQIGPTNPTSPLFLSGIQPTITLDLYVGGTLTVGAPASNPPGSYSGTFTIIFNQN